MKENSNIRSICIFRLSAIGDCINALGAVQDYQKHNPQCKITWVIGKTEYSLVKDVENINFIVFNKKDGFKGILNIRKQLKNQTFDALLHMQNSFRASIVTTVIKAKKKIGFDSYRAKDFQTLFTNTKINQPKSDHVLDGFIEFFCTLDPTYTRPTKKLQWNFFLSEKEQQFGKNNTPAKTVVLTPCTSKTYKNWTTEGYIKVIKYLIDNKYNILICGGNSTLEQHIANQIESELKSTQIVNLIGKTSLKEMVAIIKNAEFVISPDSGPVHMANACEIPVIGLYAHHSPKRVGPYYYLDLCVSVYDDILKANNINNKNWRYRIKDEKAMEQIKDIDVINNIKTIINNK